MEEGYGSRCQKIGIEMVDLANEKIKDLQEKYDVLKRCGLEDRAIEHIQPKIDEAKRRRDDLIKEINRNKAIATKKLLMCLCAADLATYLADDFADTTEKISYGLKKKEQNSFAQQLRILAEQFNKVVCHIDGIGNEAMSMFYADMAEECVDASTNVISDIVDRYMNTERGERYWK
ncbi:MAG: hypothetical protein ACI4XS_07505 [Bacillus sp. (in: firmicutes)]